MSLLTDIQENLAHVMEDGDMKGAAPMVSAAKGLHDLLPALQESQRVRALFPPHIARMLGVDLEPSPIEREPPTVY